VEIARQIGTYDALIVRAVKQEYQVSSWAEFLTLCQAPLSHQSLMHLEPEEYKKVGGESLQSYKNFVIDSYIIKGYTRKEIDALIPGAYPGYTEKNLKNRYGGIREARKWLVAPILALCFQKGYNSKEICQKVPFFEKRMVSSETWKVISYWSFEWFGINPTQARAALRYSSLDDFLAEYLNR
jgi:hypothetical protein